LSRFSKIGGEMVPHGAVEQKINEIYQVDQNEGPAAIVVGVPDSSKGEALVLLTSIDIKWRRSAREALQRGPAQSLDPQIIRRVEKIPLLGSGKTDFQRLQQLAMEAAK